MKTLSTTVLLIFSVLCSPVFSNDNPIYIWQREWKPEILDSVNQLKPLSGHFMVLAGEITKKNNHVLSTKLPVNWKYVKYAGVITIDIRMRTELAKNLQGKDISPITRTVQDLVKEIIKDARKSGVDVKGLQLDYDCPTAQLSAFTRLTKELKKNIPNLTISITALPTWMTSKDFPPLISSVDYYVLQLHSFEIPKGNDKRQYIFPKDKALGYFQRAAGFHKLFYLSLPTYGYEVAYSKTGKFIGLRAEGGVQFYGEGIQRKMMYTDPKEIIEYLQSIDKIKNDSFLGVCWFRLPISSDRFNWNIKTLEKVIKREYPKGGIDVEIRTTPNGGKEVYVKNSGELNYQDNINFDIYWNGTKPIFDVLGDFDYTDSMNGKGLHITGKAPLVSQSKMVAWFRSSDKNSLTISNSGVNVHE